MSEENKDGTVADTEKKEATAITERKRTRGIMSRIWNGIFRFKGDDFEKRLQHISKEEAGVLARMKRRSLARRKVTRHLIIFSVVLERYDPDPAAKAAAATVLASKLGAESGLNVYVGDETKLSNPTGKSNGVEFVQASGLRNRKQVNGRPNSALNAPVYYSEFEMLSPVQSESRPTLEHHEVVEHHNPQAYTAHDGWISRIAALLVGDDPAQSYALICGNCHMHNGLAKKEDFPYITYYCPHCHALNQPKQIEEHSAASGSPQRSAVASRDSVKVICNDSGSQRNVKDMSKLVDGVGTEIVQVVEGVASSKESAD